MSRLRTAEEVKAACPDGVAHTWSPGTEYLTQIYTEVVVFFCSRCTTAVGVSSAQSIPQVMEVDAAARRMGVARA